MKYEIRNTKYETNQKFEFKNSCLSRISCFEFRASKGFTLVEMIVAIAIFMIVAVVAVGSLVRIVALNRQAQALQASVNNVSFAIDSMSREIRQGSNIGCLQTYGGEQFTPSASSGCTSLSPNANALIYFRTAKVDSNGCNLYYAYWFMPAATAGQYILEKGQQRSCTDPFQYNGGNGNFYPIIDTANVTLTGYNLAVFSSGNFTYKWVFVRLKGIAGIRAQDQNTFDVETSLSQRVND